MREHFTPDFGCESISPRTEAEFIFINESGSDVGSVEVFVQDENSLTSTKVGNSRSVFKFENVRAGETTAIRTAKYKEISFPGNGGLMAMVKTTPGDSLSTGLGNFKDYRNAQEFAPARWQTIEIRLSNPRPGNEELVLQSTIAYYKDGKFVERYGR